MTTLVFLLFWVVLALALLFAAMRGGGSARERLRSQVRSGSRLPMLAFGAAVLGLGIVIPGLVIASGREQNSVPQSGISELTSREERGRELFAEQCRQCHTLEAAAASAVVGPNLDTLRPTYGLVLDAIEQGRARGNGAMAADLVVGEDAEAVSAFVARAVGKADSIGAETDSGGEAEAEGGEDPVGGDQEQTEDEGAPGGDTAASEGGAGDTPAGTTEQE